ncbi:MAG: helix-turn-helix transcriptional regulator [Coriobacteriales bacterium]|nr:helix-turn-helix transcriptional regulator [Coriobacteriales bacterium]
MIETDYSLYGKMDNYETADSLAHERNLDIVLSIAAEMERQGLSQTDLAKRMGVTRSYISQLLSGNANMTIKTLAKFEYTLGVNIISVDTSLYEQRTSAVPLATLNRMAA